MRVDPEQIRRVVVNLVDNAIEATQPERHASRIETQHDPSNNLARLVLADNGPGIPPADRDKLFMPYYSTKRRGSGLGLAIVRRIVAEHGGTHRGGREHADRGAVYDRTAVLRAVRPRQVV